MSRMAQRVPVRKATDGVTKFVNLRRNAVVSTVPSPKT